MPMQGWLGKYGPIRVGEFVALDAPQFVGGDALWVADLRFETAIEKGVLVVRDPLTAFATEDGYLRCSRKIARVRQRAAVDDIIQKRVLEPLEAQLQQGLVPHDCIVDIVIRATPQTVAATALRIYVLTTDTADVHGMQAAFDDWHAALNPTLPEHLTFLGVNVREARAFSWLDSRGTELVDFSGLSDEQANPT